MITYLRGIISEINPTNLVIECNGVGYLVNISLNTYTAFQEQKEAKILIAQIIREDAHLLYGFATEAERELFHLLLGISGIGPNTARVILSTYTAPELRKIISLGEIEPIKAVKGIGLKTAQRIILELKGKIVLEEDEESELSPKVLAKGGGDSETMSEARAGLKMLGFTEASINKVLKKLIKEDPSLSVEELIRQGLKLL